MTNLYDPDRHNKPATDTKERDFLGRGSGTSNVAFFRQADEPTPVESKINFWYDTSNGHKYYYDDVNTRWVDEAGWA